MIYIFPVGSAVTGIIFALTFHILSLFVCIFSLSFHTTFLFDVRRTFSLFCLVFFLSYLLWWNDSKQQWPVTPLLCCVVHWPLSGLHFTWSSIRPSLVITVDVFIFTHSTKHFILNVIYWSCAMFLGVMFWLTLFIIRPINTSIFHILSIVWSTSDIGLYDISYTSNIFQTMDAVFARV